MLYTVRHVMRCDPCYTEKRVRRLLPHGRRSLRLTEILELKFPARHKVWIGCHFLRHDLLREFVCDCVQAAAKLAGPEAVRCARALRGKSMDRLDAAKNRLYDLCAAPNVLVNSVKWGTLLAAQFILYNCKSGSSAAKAVLDLSEQSVEMSNDQLELLRLYAVIEEGGLDVEIHG